MINAFYLQFFSFLKFNNTKLINGYLTQLLRDQLLQRHMPNIHLVVVIAIVIDSELKSHQSNLGL